MTPRPDASESTPGSAARPLLRLAVATLPRTALAVLALAACGRPPDPAPAPRPAVAPRPAPAVPERPTFSADIAAIVHEHCAPCHHDGGPAPFPLTSYDHVRDRAAQIVEVTASGYMPPWLPEPGFGEFTGARVLGDLARQTLARWHEQGAPHGDPAAAPRPPTFAGGWQLGTPDLVLEMPEPYEAPADGADIYRNFVIPAPPGPLRFVRAVEILPGNPQVVHHAVLRIDHTGGARRRDATDPGPGFHGMIFAGALMPDGRFLGWTPGKAPDPGSEARAWRLPGGCDLVLQLHLRPTGKPERVRAKIGLYFSTRPPTRPTLAMELSTTAIDLPPGARDVHARDRYTVPVDVTVTSVYPHAHYLGKSVAAWAELPDGTRTWLVKIDDWDFLWQDQYRFVRPPRLPAGATIHMDWTFDNSADNPRNPFSPPRHVVYGPASTDEMAELILEIEPVDVRDLARLDQDFRRKWLTVQLEHFERELAARPDDPDVAANLGAMRQILGDGDGARAAYETALRSDPAHVQANHELATVLMTQGRLDDALAHLRRAATRLPADARIELALGDVRRKRDEPDQAITHYRRAIALDGALVEAHNNLGIVLEARGDLAEAAAAFQRASELRPETALFRNNLARVRARLR